MQPEASSVLGTALKASRSNTPAHAQTRPFTATHRWLATLICVLLCTLGSAGCSKEARLSRHLDRANRYFEQHEYDKAELEYLNVARLDHNHALALERLGSIYFQQGRARDAMAFLRQAKAAAPANAATRVKLGRLSQAGGQWDAAREEAAAVLEKDPVHEEALLILSETSVTPEQLDQASERLRAFEAQAGNKAAGRIASGNLALRRGDLPTAEREFVQATTLDPKSAPAQLALANLRWRQGDLTQADSAFAAAVELAPDDTNARFQWAGFKLQTGAIAEARKLIEQILEKNPRHTTALLYLGRLAFAERRFDDCTELINRLLSQVPGYPEARLLRGQLSLAKGDSAQAITEFKQLRTEFPNVPQFSYHLALAQIESRTWNDAAASLEQTLKLDPNLPEPALVLAEIDVVQRGQYGPAIQSLTNLLQRFPRLERAYTLLADAHRRKGELDQALAACDRWQTAVTNSPRARHVVGLLRRQLRQPAEARQAFEQAVQLAPNFFPAVEQLTELDLQDNRGPAAVQRAQEFATAHPTSSAPWLLLAKTHIALGASAEAEQALRKVMELEPNSNVAPMLLAQVYIRNHQRDQALQNLRAILEKNPNDATALLLAGELEHGAKEYAKARATYEKLLKVNPKSVPALNNLAYMCVEDLQDIEAGYRYAQQAYQLAPKEPSVADTLGWALCHRKEFNLALPLLREAADKRPNDSEVQFHLGTAYYMTGQEAPARAAFSQALTQTNFVSRAKAEQRLWTLDCDPETAGSAETARLEQILAQEPGDLVALLRLAGIAAREATPEKALTYYRRAQETNPKSTAVQLALGRFYSERLQDHTKALEIAKTLEDLAPNDPQVALAAGQIAAQAGDYKRAYRLLRSGSPSPEQPGALFHLAMASYHLGRVPEAVEIMRQAASAAPTAPSAEPAKRFLRLVELADRPAQAATAAQEAAQILERDPKYVPALMLLAAVREQRSDWDQARQIYEAQILQTAPDFAPAARRLAFLYAEHLGDDAKALSAGSKAREVFKDDPELSKCLGKAAVRRKDGQQAIQLLSEVTRQRPQDADAFYHLGLGYHQLNRKDQTRTALEKAVSLNLNAEQLAEAKRILSALQ